MRFFLIGILLSFLLFGCDKGLEPLDEDTLIGTGFTGTITFNGEWPDSVFRTVVVLFKDNLNSPLDFNIVNLRYISEEIPYGVNSYEYSSLQNFTVANVTAGEYAYLAVAQSKTEELSLDRKDWYVVGLYAADESQQNPATLKINNNEVKQNVNIVCDFNNPPIQPPGGISD